MSGNKLKMRKLNDIFRLKFDLHLSNRQTAKSCNISHSVVGEYLSRFHLSGLQWPLGKMSEEELYLKLFPEKQTKINHQSKPLPDWIDVDSQLKKFKHLTLQLIWEEYRESFPNGYGRSQFCFLFSEWKKSLEIPFRQNYRGGEKMLVDYAGSKVKIVSPVSGEIEEASIFIIVLGASNYTYAEAHLNQDTKNWINGHVRAFNFFGGVTEQIIPDNLKAGVKSACFYDPELNPTYNNLADYYGVAVLPARKRKPKDKAKVEGGVKIFGQRILAKLRNRTFFSIQQLNGAIKEELIKLNDRQMDGYEKSRKELFEIVDKPNLKSLPQRPYEYALWKIAKVNVDYHVGYDKSFYSVPYKFIGKKVELRITEKIIEVYYDHERIASHLRSYEKNHFVTLEEHMPSKHKFMTGWSAKRFINWASKIGPFTQNLVEEILNSKEYPQQSFRKCLGILSLSKSHNNERLEAAVQRALHYKIFSFRKIRNILNKGLDKVNLENEKNLTNTSQPPLNHENIRGDQYYKGENKSQTNQKEPGLTPLDILPLFNNLKEKKNHENN